MRPALTLLVGGYLSLDWIHDYGNPWVAVEEFARRELTKAARLSEEVAELLSEAPNEQTPRHLVVDELEAATSLKLMDGRMSRG